MALDADSCWERGGVKTPTDRDVEGTETGRNIIRLILAGSGAGSRPLQIDTSRGQRLCAASYTADSCPGRRGRVGVFKTSTEADGRLHESRGGL